MGSLSHLSINQLRPDARCKTDSVCPAVFSGRGRIGWLATASAAVLLLAAAVVVTALPGDAGRPVAFGRTAAAAAAPWAVRLQARVERVALTAPGVADARAVLGFDPASGQLSALYLRLTPEAGRELAAADLAGLARMLSGLVPGLPAGGLTIADDRGRVRYANGAIVPLILAREGD